MTFVTTQKQQAVVLTQQQQQIADIIQDYLLDLSKNHLVIQGVAGSGKSTLLNDVINHYILNVLPNLRSMNLAHLYSETIKITATTNKALNALGCNDATTIHSLLKLRVGTNYDTGETFLYESDKKFAIRNTIIFVDEYSQIDVHLFKFIKKAMQPEYKNKFIFIGDCAQLPPVNEKMTQVDLLPNHAPIEMTHSYRLQNLPTLSQYAFLVREYILGRIPKVGSIPKNTDIIKMSKEDFYNDLIKKLQSGYDAKYIAYTNANVKENNMWIRKQLVGNTNFVVGDVVVINKPANDMQYATDSRQKIADISDYTTFHEIKGRWIRFEGSKSWFLPNKWYDVNRLLKSDYEHKQAILDSCFDMNYEYAITSYKAQGATYDYVYIDLSQLKIAQHDFWKHFYVAITRATKGVVITGA